MGVDGASMFTVEDELEVFFDPPKGKNEGRKEEMETG